MCIWGAIVGKDAGLVAHGLNLQNIFLLLNLHVALLHFIWCPKHNTSAMINRQPEEHKQYFQRKGVFPITFILSYSLSLHSSSPLQLDPNNLPNLLQHASAFIVPMLLDKTMHKINPKN